MSSKLRNALVTGGNRGIGFQIARQRAQQGLTVVATCRSQEDGEAAQASLAAEGLSVRFEIVDVTDREAVQALAGRLLDEYGAIDILVNNAGVALDKWRPALELDPELIRQTMEVNFIGALNFCQAFMPAMQQQEYGRVVNISSQMGSLASMTGYLLAYRSSKTALNALTRCLAGEMKETPDVLINSMCPGWVKTGLGGDDAPRSPEQGAETAVWLATLPAGGPTGGFFKDREPLPF